jgi:hypothetical protein
MNTQPAHIAGAMGEDELAGLKELLYLFPQLNQLDQQAVLWGERLLVERKKRIFWITYWLVALSLAASVLALDFPPVVVLAVGLSIGALGVALLLVFK